MTWFLPNRTSISDFEDYKNTCIAATIDDAIFDSFRSNGTYCKILEHVSRECGEAYLKHAVETNKEVIDSKIIDIFMAIDKLGGSNKSQFHGIGTISPTILRYFSVLSDIHSLYGNLDDKVIVEIGAGYGGQSMMINLLHKVKKYVIVDLPEVNGLIRKFLCRNNIDLSNYEFYTHQDVPHIDSDYLISNYAFSECWKNIQDIYLDRLINKTRNFYMILNFCLDHERSREPFSNMYHKEDLLKRIQGKVHVAQETPSTSRSNLVFYR